MRQLNESDPRIPARRCVACVDAHWAMPVRRATSRAPTCSRATRPAVGRSSARGTTTCRRPENDGRTLNAGSVYLELFPSEFSKLVAGYEAVSPIGRHGDASPPLSGDVRARPAQAASVLIDAALTLESPMIRPIKLLLLAVVLALAPRAADAQLKVVTSTTDLYDIAKAVGGDRITATHIGEGYQDPHFIEAKPSFVLQLRNADVWAFVGLDLEIGWMPLLLDGARNPKIRRGGSGYVDVSTVIRVLDRPTGQHRSQHGGRARAWATRTTGSIRRTAGASRGCSRRSSPSSIRRTPQRTTRTRAGVRGEAQRGGDRMGRRPRDDPGQADRRLAHELALLRRLQQDEHRRLHGAEARGTPFAVAPVSGDPDGQAHRCEGHHHGAVLRSESRRPRREADGHQGARSCRRRSAGSAALR